MWPRFCCRLITYSADGVRDKNNDAHVAGFTALAKTSDSALVRALFHDKADTTKGMDSPAGPKRVAASFKYAGANRKKARTAQTVNLNFLSSFLLVLDILDESSLWRGRSCVT